jgi:hypothetical protein
MIVYENSIKHLKILLCSSIQFEKYPAKRIKVARKLHLSERN